MNSGNYLLHSKMTLYVSSEKIYIEAESSSDLFIIDRISDRIYLEVNNGQAKNFSSMPQKIYGLVGIINLISGPYLIVIDKALDVGDIRGCQIFQIESVDIIPFRKTTTHLTEQQIKFNNTYLNMVKSVLRTPFFYFSYNFDLSHSFQRLHTNGPNFLNHSLFERADERFLWNKSLMLRINENKELHLYCLPIVHGFFSTNQMYFRGKNVKIILISRRSVQRAGTRLFCRGADTNGNTANFVETEQIIEFNSYASSFVQIRGSIPLVWTQYPNIKYKPVLQLCPTSNQVEVFSKHLKSIQKIYGKVIFISLIDHKKSELVLKKELTQVLNTVKESNNYVKYISFDFHEECKQNRWDKLSNLIEKIELDQKEMACFSVAPDGTVLSIQDGIFRTNCIDSLDRTNVVQNLIAKKNLEEQLKILGVMHKNEKLDSYYNNEFIYRNAWADNADYCSIQYAGTGALKTDFTRTGKRSIFGLVKDGINSLRRYYKNNFTDGFRQDSIDLFLGFYSVHESEGKTTLCPLFQKKDWKYLALPTLLLGSLAMFFFSLFVPSEFTTETFLYLIFWSGMFTFNGLMIFLYGKEFVDVPKLSKKQVKYRRSYFD